MSERDWLDFGDGWGVDMAEVVSLSRNEDGGTVFRLRGEGEALEKFVVFSGGDVAEKVESWLAAQTAPREVTPVSSQPETVYHWIKDGDWQAPREGWEVMLGYVTDTKSLHLAIAYYDPKYGWRLKRGTWNWEPFPSSWVPTWWCDLPAWPEEDK